MAYAKGSKELGSGKGKLKNASTKDLRTKSSKPGKELVSNKGSVATRRASGMKVAPKGPQSTMKQKR
jgi:hypothetical protein